ncbi:hypothetical protein [Streptomyces tirandamycinicus]|uniref:Uncharacterized protein n=1 Tax=Streptomyces tirandamycinicus TaxID=2174846 RepID=A0A2S1T276_9ACTN|nr:hypothetical protein [Streptomyces tirandamycinicus]AWI32738.1 hypothetical protein DDW44_30970 [Streptomyces tirandamycinicus]
MSDQPTPPPVESTDDLPPLKPEEMPSELKDARRRMSQRGPVVDMGTGETVAEAGRLAGEKPAGGLVACSECARAVALGWWGSISRHLGAPDAPVCVLCSEGEATLSAEEWFSLTAQLVVQRTRDGQRRTWRDDALVGIGAVNPESLRRPPGDES